MEVFNASEIKWDIYYQFVQDPLGYMVFGVGLCGRTVRVLIG